MRDGMPPCPEILSALLPQIVRLGVVSPHFATGVLHWWVKIENYSIIFVSVQTFSFAQEIMQSSHRKTPLMNERINGLTILLFPNTEKEFQVV